MGALAINESYLCLWQNSNTTIQKWRKEEDLLHPDNIFFDHNLLTIIQYNNNLLAQTMTKTYTTYLIHVQTKDKKFIQPPFKITNLTTSIQECNPDKDILVHKPTIQIHTTIANVYDQNGNYIATINIDRLQWLWNQFTHNNQQHLTNFLHPPSQDFETKVLWLLQRSVTILSKKKPKIIQPQNLHQTLHPDIIKTLITTFQITHTYYSSSLTCPTQLTQFHSPYNRDIIFGSLGHAKSSKWT